MRPARSSPARKKKPQRQPCRHGLHEPNRILIDDAISYYVETFLASIGST
jgi:hypothetical protein